MYFLLQVSAIAAPAGGSEVGSRGFHQNEALESESNLPPGCEPSTLHARSRGFALGKARAQRVWSVFNSSPLSDVSKS